VLGCLIHRARFALLGSNTGIFHPRSFEALAQTSWGAVSGRLSRSLAGPGSEAGLVDIHDTSNILKFPAECWDRPCRKHTTSDEWCCRSLVQEFLGHTTPIALYKVCIPSSPIQVVRHTCKSLFGHACPAMRWAYEAQNLEVECWGPIPDDYLHYAISGEKAVHTVMHPQQIQSNTGVRRACEKRKA
jgi:hypothetical protein